MIDIEAMRVLLATNRTSYEEMPYAYHNHTGLCDALEEVLNAYEAMNSTVGTVRQ